VKSTLQARIRYTPIRDIQNHVLEKNGRLTSPLTVSLEITNACDQNCVFCIQTAKHQSHAFEKRHIALKYVERLIREAKSLGVLEFQISGGEPTCHPQFMKIVELVKDFQFRTSIITNGVNFSPNETVKLANVLEAERDLFIVGLDAADPETYKRLRGQDHFALVCETLRMMREAGLPFATQTVIVKDNVSSLQDIWGLSASYGSKAHILVLPYRIRDIHDDIYLSDEETALCLTCLSNDVRCRSANSTPLVFPAGFNEEYGTGIHRICLSGRTSCAINALGEIHICAFALDCGLSVGNINSTSLDDAWKRIRRIIETTAGADSLSHGHRCPVKTELLQYDIADT